MCLCVCVCLCVSIIEIQTFGPISMKLGTVEDHDLGVVFLKKCGLWLASHGQKTSTGQTVRYLEKFIKQKLWGTPDIEGAC